MNFQDDSLRDLIKITSQDNTYNYFEKEVNQLAYYMPHITNALWSIQYGYYTGWIQL